jgi:hypothetical protein
MAYVTEPGATETSKLFKHRIYGALREMAANSEGATEMRIKHKYPTTCWEKVWKNLHRVEASDSVISTWYQAIHDIIRVPTNERLATIRLTDAMLCARFRNTDTLQHRIVACGEGPVLWQWTRTRIAAILQRDPRSIPAEWTIRPDAKLGRHRNKGQSYGTWRT